MSNVRKLRVLNKASRVYPAFHVNVFSSNFFFLSFIFSIVGDDVKCRFRNRFDKRAIQPAQLGGIVFKRRDESWGGPEGVDVNFFDVSLTWRVATVFLPFPFFFGFSFQELWALSNGWWIICRWKSFLNTKSPIFSFLFMNFRTAFSAQTTDVKMVVFRCPRVAWRFQTLICFPAVKQRLILE
jgi:hypothetical protein